MSKSSTRKTTNSKSTKQRILMPMNEELVNDIKELSNASGSSPQNVIAGLVWLGKKMFGREVILQSKDETVSLTIHAFEELTKLSKLDDVD